MCSPREPLSIDRIELYRVGLILTEQCNIACAHCWFGSNPRKTSRMSLGEALGYIDQVSEIPTVEWISISGGEPFLFPEMLKQIILSASRKGLYTECVTNCFWAKSEAATFKTLLPLKDAGLNVLNISTDDFHQTHLPFSFVRNCYQVSRRLGLKIVIMCTVGRSSNLTLDRVACLLGDEDIRILGKGHFSAKPITALAVQSGFLPAGRAASIPEDELMLRDSPLHGPCRTVLHDVSISPSGAVLPCCSAGGLVKGFEIGNIGQNQLGEMILKASRNQVFRVLLNEGPESLQRRYGLFFREKGYVNKCHLCYEVLQDVMRRNESGRPCQVRGITDA